MLPHMGATLAISIHAPRTGSDGLLAIRFTFFNISIHAPRTGSDNAERLKQQIEVYFNPRSPHGERRENLEYRRNYTIFQSTLPARGATIFLTQFPQRSADFNPRSPHGERLFVNCSISVLSEFQSTLPARGATISTDFWNNLQTFQSTLPARGATRRGSSVRIHQNISIHAPRTGSDRD